MDRKLKIRLLRLTAPVGAVLFAVLLSSVFLIAIDKNPLTVYLTMLAFGLGRMDSIAAILFNATPLIFSGLAVAISFKAGMFNIGVEGQYFIGAVCAAWVGFAMPGLPAVVHIPLTLLAAMTGGMLWALVPVYLKVKRGVHEVISTIMLNYVAYSLVHYLIADLFMDHNQKIPEGLGSALIRTPKFLESAMMPTIHAFMALWGVELPGYIYVNWFLMLALVVAAGVGYLLNRTPLGYELRAVGHNPLSAEAAGIRTETVYIKTFLLSGAIAGLTGLSHLLVFYEYMDLDFPKNFGFNGIAVALIGGNHPMGIVLAALLFGFLSRGAEGVQTILGVPMDAVVIMQGIIILSVVVVAGILGRYLRRLEKKEAP
ncbi:MAG TPA: ABC transporter permease [Patescibacteria group bacterium]|nr:ABC transporter permease [Patescibacteria group bacterium]